jgi:hypothetical protein
MLKNNKSEDQKRRKIHFESEKRKREMYQKNEHRAKVCVKKNIITKYEQIMMDLLDKK